MPTDIQISYSVRAFLGEPNADPKQWPTDPNYVGQLASMSSPRMNSSVIVTGNIGLTEKLALKHQIGELKSLDKDTVTAYLKANFSWRIQALDFSEIPRNNPPAGLNVTVFSVPVKIPESETEVATWVGEAEYNHEIEGNPPVYNGPGPDGTNSTIPENEVGGVYNATSGEFVWKNATESVAAGGEEVASGTPVETSRLTSLTPQATLSSSPFSTPTPTPTPETSSAPAVSEEAPEPTTPAGPRTKYVTSIIMEYVTV